MPVQLKFNIDDREVQQFFTGLIYRGQNLQPVMRGFGERMQRSVAKNFRAGGRPEKWTPSKRAEATGGQTLIKTGRLRSSITYEAGTNYLTIGTNVIYSRIHQLGGYAGRGRKVKIPARPYLVFQAEDLKYLGLKLIKYLTEG